MRIMCRSREVRQGRIGRYRTYKCRGCGRKFQTPDILVNPLPENRRFCPECREKAERDLSLVVGVAVRQGVYWRPDAKQYFSDARYREWLGRQRGKRP